jgi:hypothetical protein
MQTLSALSISLFLYLMLAASSLGMGTVLAHFLGIPARSLDNWRDRVWLGWCALLLLLQLCHYLVPLNIYCSVAFYGLGLFLLALSCLVRGLPKAPAPSHPAKAGKIVWLMLFIFALWVALQAMKAPGDFDSGLYHFNSIRWINEYAIVPGLGNLHDRLAFNYAFFPFVASLNFYPWFNHGHNIALSWLLLLVTAESLFSLGRVGNALRNRQELPTGDVFPALLFPYLLYVGCTMDLSSPQSDRASFCARLMLFIYLWRNLAAKDRAEILISAKFVLILGVTALTLKLSNLAFAGVACLIAVLRCFGGKARQPWLILRSLGSTLFFGSIILLTWLGAGVITSGYPLFPSTFLGFPTDWKIDPASVKRTSDLIRSWPRWPGHDPAFVLAGWGWLRPWSAQVWQTGRIDVILPFALFLVAACAVTILSVALRSHERPLWPLYLGLLPLLAGLLFWFYVSPDPRFVYGLFWLLPLAVLCPYVMNEGSPGWKRGAILILLAMMCLPLALQLGPPFVAHPKSIILQSLTFSRTGWQPIKTAALEEKATDQGLKIYIPVPAKLERHESPQCWDSPLPSAPYFNPDLQLRGRDLQSGFKTLPYRE